MSEETGGKTLEEVVGLPRRVILLPVDDTEATEATVDWLVQEFAKPGDMVDVLHVVAVPQVDVGIGMEYYPILIDSSAVDDAAHIAAARQFMKQRVCKRLAEAGLPFKIIVAHAPLDPSSIGKAICSRAEALQVSCVVMSKHQRGLLSELLMGSVTNYALKHLKQPLVLLH